MGLAASQARYLFLTARKSGIEFQQMQIANDKISLSRQTEEVSDAYSKALNATKVTVGTTSGTTADVTYSGLMTYGNTSGQYILVNANDQVVLSDDDAALIKNLSGSTGGPFSVTKSMEESYLASKMGASAADADKYISSYNPAAASSDSNSNSSSSTQTVSSILKSLSGSNGNFTSDGNNYNWNQLYNAGDEDSQTIYLGDDSKGSDSDSMRKQFESVLTSFTKTLSGLGIFDSSALTEAYQNTTTQFENMQSDNFRHNYITGCAAGVNQIEDYRKNGSHTHNYAVNAKNLLNSFFTYYQMALGNTTEDGLNNLSVANSVKASGSTGTNYATSVTTSAASSSTGSSASTSSQADFYLNQLIAVASKGWVDESAVTDKSSLQTAITNNATFIEKYSANGWTQATTGNSTSGLSEEDDATAQADAEAKYKADSAKLNTKESELDLQEKNLETERSEIDTEIDSVKSVISKNVERSFKMFA